jgi:hypothetical protein
LVQAQSNLPETGLSGVLTLLESRFNVKFAYDPELIQSLHVAHSILATENIQSALQMMVATLPLEYLKSQDGQILLRKKRESLNPVPEREQTVIITGILKDAWTGELLPFADLIGENGTGFSTDEQGRFSVQVLPNSSLTFSYLGYEPKKITFSSHREHISLNLVPKLNSLPTIEIKAKIPGVITKSERGYRILNSGYWEKMPPSAIGNDLLRSMQQLPGISATNDLSAELKIRGSNSDENLILLDGITLYHVTHFSGMFSVVNADAIRDVKLYKNVLPVTYGGKTASVIELSSLSPRENMRSSGKISGNLLTSQAVVQVGISPKQSILLSGRMTNGTLGNSGFFGLLHSQNREMSASMRPVDPNPVAREISGYRPDFKFHDVQGKWNMEINAKQNLQIAFFYGYDQLDYTFQKSTKTVRAASFYLRNEHFKEYVDWKNRGTSLVWNFNPSKKWENSFLWSVSDFQNNASIQNEVKVIEDKKNTSRFYFENTHFNEISGLDLKWTGKYTSSNTQSWVYGVQTTRNQVAYEIKQDQWKPLAGQEVAWQSAAFAEVNQKVKDWSIQLGGRLNTYKQKTYFSPGIYVSYQQVHNPYSIKGSFGKYYQFLRQLNHEDRYGRNYVYQVLSNEQFPVLSSLNSMVGVTAKWEKWEVDLECYQKNSTGVLEQALMMNYVNNPDSIQRTQGFSLFQGSGNIRGIDLYMRHTGKIFTGTIAYTLSKSTQKFEGIGRGISFPSANDRRHQLKLNTQLTLGIFDFFVTYNFASGRPYTDLAKILEQNEKIKSNLKANPGNPIGGMLNFRRDLMNPLDRLSYLEDYHRVDIGFAIPIHLNNDKSFVLEASIFNLFNRKNVSYRQFIFQLPASLKEIPSAKELIVGNELQMPGITPNVNLMFSF